MRHTLALACLLSAAGSLAEFTPPPAEPDEFHFVVLGDAQFHKPELFNRIVDQARRLRPAFVLQVGDLIQGYNNDLNAVKAQWDRFANQVAPLEPVPYIAIAGNHDVYNGDRKVDARMEGLFEQRWGPLYFEFSYKNTQFIVLNSDSTEGENMIAGRQLAWLRRTLATPGPAHRFVFMHRPPLRTANAEELHDLFRSYGVSHVFYGHHHHYHYLERDGIEYVMTNAAANSVSPLAQTGGLPHLLQVAVRGEEVAIAPITADAILAKDAVHPTDNYDFYALQTGLAPARIKLHELAPNRFNLTMPLRNVSERDATLYIACASADQRWLFEPAAITPLTLAAGASQSLTIAASYAPRRVPESEPVCELRVPYQTSGGEWIELRHSITGER